MTQFFTHPAFLVFLVVAGIAIVLFVRQRRAWTRAAGQPSLVDNPPPRPDFALTRRSLEGIGTIELPSGPEWEGTRTSFYNEQLGMSIIIQTQIQSFAGRAAAYLASYELVNQRDAPNWQRGPEQLGQVAGLEAARTNGRFDNGTPMVTRDYLFFAAFTTVLLQSRVPAEHAEALAITDYLAATFRRK